MPDMIYNMLCVLEIMPLPVRIIASLGLLCDLILIVIIAIGFANTGFAFSQGEAPHYVWVMLILGTVSIALLGKYRQQFP